MHMMCAEEWTEAKSITAKLQNVTAGAEILQDNDHMGKRVGEDPLQCALTAITLRVK
jgi:hypothetical protein